MKKVKNKKIAQKENKKLKNSKITDEKRYNFG